jgi:hypothetical protein
MNALTTVQSQEKWVFNPRRNGYLYFYEAPLSKKFGERHTPLTPWPSIEGPRRGETVHVT